MAIYANSLALSKYMSYIENIDIKTKFKPTLEGFMVAAIDDALGNIYLKSESTEKVKALLTAFGVDLKVAREKLVQHMSTYDYVLEDTEKIKELKRKIRDDEKYLSAEEFLPEMLVERIFSEPTDAIKNAFSSPKTEADSKKDEIEAALDDLLKKKPTADPDTPSEGDGKPKVAAAPIEVLPDEVEPMDPKQFLNDLTVKVKNMRKELSDRVFGQDNAINIFATGYFQAELLSLTDKARQKPKATFLFAGPPGTGKTYLAENIAELLGLPFCRFDMSEYADKEACIEFAGSDKVYKNGKAGNVTSFVEQNPRCVVLFDEIEKAHITVIHLFLQLLDAGRLRDNYTDNEISFKDVVVIFTTNAGKQFYDNDVRTDYSGVSRKVILKALEKDVNPGTGTPLFPAAICSRFATGNVVMFNHISAHNLRNIAKREVLRHADNFEKEIGIKVNIDERVFSALLFAEGGAADARTVRARAESFFDDEMFELFRLVSSESVTSGIAELQTVNIGIDLPQNAPEVMALFQTAEKPNVMVFCSDETLQTCSSKTAECNFISVKSIPEAEAALDKNEIKVVLIDLDFGEKRSSEDYLNIEDIDSEARDVFKHIREYHADLPVYLLETESHKYCHEEKVSFIRQGVRDVIALNSAEEYFGKEISEICGKIHQQQNMLSLAKSNRLVTFGTAQRLCDGGATAEIRLFDLRLNVALDPDDSKNVLSNVSKPKVKFSDVIGAEDAKKELEYFVQYLKNPKKYAATGVRPPKGILLYGPPGTGKTMLAKALAGETDVTFITSEGNRFLKRYVGDGPKSVHDLFATARKYAPSILFIDEIDAIAKERSGSDHSAPREEVLTAFLTEMDGFKNDVLKPVFVLAATNFEVEEGTAKSLDPALMRRFDRRIFIDLPDRDDRVKYIKSQIARKEIFAVSDSMIENIAIRSTGMSLASLESVIELALRSAIREGKTQVSDVDFEEAFELFNSGDKKEWDASLLERTARHEAGHAFLCWQAGEKPSYVTVVARSNHGGYMQHGDREGMNVRTKDGLLSRIRTALGGRAAELVYYGEREGLATGASGDLRTATAVARSIVCTYGMDEEFGLAVVDREATSDGELSLAVRAAVNRILDSEMKKAVELISANRDKIDRLVEALILKNRLTGDEIDEIFKL